MASLRMMASPSVTPLSPAPTPQRAAIPGSYGFPLIGPLVDRLNYFWFQGPTNFFKKRIDKYNSTVFRTNVPPAFPFFFGVNPKVVALLDVKSFSHLFDLDLVEKNVLVGDFMPSLNYTGGMRVCAYLDTSEAKHSQIKNFAMDILKRSASTWTPTMVSTLDAMWDTIDTQLSGGSTSASVIFPIQRFLFSFLCLNLFNADPSSDPKIKNSGHIMIDKWLALQLGPVIPLNVIQPLEEILLHSFRYPFWLVKGDYNRLADFLKSEAKETIQRAETEFKLTEDEAIHNLLFILGFNAFGGFSLFFLQLITYLGEQKDVHHVLRDEVREKIKQSNGELTVDALRQMETVYSFVYEGLRLSPPVPSQFGRARKDFDLSSNYGIFAIKKGEMLCGYQPIVMQDPTIFDNPEDFVYDRFVKGKGGHELLKYVFWSNGPQAGSDGPSASNKQCPGRDFVPMTCAFFLAYIFQRYDEITISSGSITGLKKAA